MDISANTSEVKDTMDEEPLVTGISLIKAAEYFKLFKCNEQFFNNLYLIYECSCMENVKGEYWMEMNDTILNYSEWNHTPLSNAKIKEKIDKLMLEEQAESNKFLVDTFSPQINKSEFIINKVVNLAKNDVRKYSNIANASDV